MAQFDPRAPGHLSHAGTFNNNVMTMSAGIAGLTHLYTPEAAVALNARGDRLRERLNELCRMQEIDVQFTGLGSLMNVHGTSRPIRNCDDIPPDQRAVKDLFFFHMLEQGFYLARRGFIVLSLPLTDDDLEHFVAAFEGFVERYRNLLRKL